MSILAQVDLTLTLAPEAYAEQLPEKQTTVSQLAGRPPRESAPW